jgi:hypothetical protein
MLMKDRFGREVFVGCTVAYPGRAGSSCWISTGIVAEVLPQTERYRVRLRLEGGGQAKGAPLGRRQIAWSDDVLVLV